MVAAMHPQTISLEFRIENNYIELEEIILRDLKYVGLFSKS